MCLAYAIASGDFNGDRIADVAVGVPRAHKLQGHVNFYSTKQIIHSIGHHI